MRFSDLVNAAAEAGISDANFARWLITVEPSTGSRPVDLIISGRCDVAVDVLKAGAEGVYQ